MNLIYDTHAGQHFESAAKGAQEVSISKETTVEFDFNGVTCVVSSITDLGLLYRDFCNAHLMGWEIIGPDPYVQYSAAILYELATRKAQREKDDAIKDAEYKAKQDAERLEFESKTVGVTVSFSDRQAWDKGLANNTDSYGKAIYAYAEDWAKLMQVEIIAGRSVADCANETSFKLGFHGISGFMHSAAVSVLSHCWVHGQELNEAYKSKKVSSI